MRFKKILVTLTALAVAIPAAATARLAEGGTAQGAGFYRTGGDAGKGKSKATKTMIVVNATDARADGEDDGGTLNYMVHTPGSKGAHIAVSLDCVTTDGNEAFLSGVSGDTRYDIRIVDGGNPGKGNDEFGIHEAAVEDILDPVTGLLLGDCGAGDVDTTAISGGNLKVTDPD